MITCQSEGNRETPCPLGDSVPKGQQTGDRVPRAKGQTQRKNGTATATGTVQCLPKPAAASDKRSSGISNARQPKASRLVSSPSVHCTPPAQRICAQGFPATVPHYLAVFSLTDSRFPL
ncbi:hypothetical protein KLMA_40377 [Kluyveromyces marxianus DMKU3-1042]|uniref:Uncharacterized protein n=1 Tax=Kluyveromyces marxianus (strain DMKU3-1042 / BCC 29191 / NBRC 104275) TaxID=1003335 RepID=W0TC87_KLUMD|nr:hypothetical protein KLMA_40377 [Kluyveromyces marxianus DMKU3-1042]BAO40401.1 hypothetical protein KLMA_40377 [Kluyveromyces marxianus DMKU3-1042]